MEEETYTREPTSGDRLRRYNSTTMSLLRRRETGKGRFGWKGPVGQNRETNVCACMCVENCVHMFVYMIISLWTPTI